MGKVISRVLAVFAIALAVSMSSGCVVALLGLGVGAGVAGTAYYEGKLTGTVDAKPQQAQAATEAAFKELKIQQISSIGDALKAKIVGKAEKDSTVTVSVELQKDGKSRIGIRVGTFGNQELSEKIYSEINKQLSPKGTAK
ncbi:MAG: DUF3568 family protein [Victivallaceae bacterium]|nr:DUF3568 family protein [Victivallaceae bacterium]